MSLTKSEHLTVAEEIKTCEKQTSQMTEIPGDVKFRMILCAIIEKPRSVREIMLMTCIPISTVYHRMKILESHDLVRKRCHYYQSKISIYPDIGMR